MGDQFSRTIRSISDDYADKTESGVTPARRVEGKKVRRDSSTTDREPGKHANNMYSEFKRLPDPELWDVLIGSVTEFNRRQEMRDSPYEIRVWAQNNGIRLQMIHEETGDLIKQTKIIPFKDITEADLNNMINDLIGERGIVIDVTR